MRTVTGLDLPADAGLRAALSVLAAQAARLPDRLMPYLDIRIAESLGGPPVPARHLPHVGSGLTGVTWTSNFLLMRVNDTVTAAARRAQIITAAIDTIAEMGYGQASFARIAKRAGISSTRLISYHFDDKAELVGAVVGAVLTEAADHMGKRLRVAGTRPEMLAAYIESNLEFIAEHPTAIRAVIEISANARSDDGSPLVRPGDLDDPVARLAAMFRDGQAAGDFRTFDPVVMAVTLRAAIDAAAGRPDLDPHDYAAELVTLFTLATRKDPA